MEEVTNVHKIEAKVIKSHSEQVLTDLPCFWMLWELLSLWPVLKIMKSSQVVKLLFPKRTFASVHLCLICCWYRDAVISNPAAHLWMETDTVLTAHRAGGTTAVKERALISCCASKKCCLLPTCTYTGCLNFHN